VDLNKIKIPGITAYTLC